MANERETPGILKWLSKAIIAINLLSGGAQTGKIVAEYINESKCINRRVVTYLYHHKTSEHVLKS